MKSAYQKCLRFFLSICLVVHFFFILPVGSVAASNSFNLYGFSSNLLALEKISLPTRKPARRSFWASIKGLARRGKCSSGNSLLISISPSLSPAESKNTISAIEGAEKAVYGHGTTLTAQSRPIFWFYLPPESGSLETTKTAEFMIQDENSEDVLEKPLQVELSGSGLFSFRLPDLVQDLPLNHPYHWYFSVVCDPQNPSRNPHVDDWIERVSIAGQSETSLAAFEEKLELYTNNNLWPETLELLSSEYCLHPNQEEVRNYLSTLLSSSFSDSDLDSLGFRSLDELFDSLLDTSNFCQSVA